MNDERYPEAVQLSEADARALVRRGQAAITRAIEAMAELRAVLPPLWEGRAWTVLGYGSWEEMCQAEFGIRLPRVERKRLAGELAEGGMGVRAIAFGLGVDPATISRDLSVANATPERTVANATPEAMTYQRWLATTGIPTLTEEEFADALAVVGAELGEARAELEHSDGMPVHTPRTAQDNADEFRVRSGGRITLTMPDTPEEVIARLQAISEAMCRLHRAEAALVRLGLCLPDEQQEDGSIALHTLVDQWLPEDEDPDRLAAHAELERIADSGRWTRMERTIVAAALDVLLSAGGEQLAE